MTKQLIVTHKTPQSNEIHITQITDVVNGSIDELIINNSLDYIENRLEGIKILVSKIRYGGTIEITGTDIFALMRSSSMFKYSLLILNKILYEGGKQSIDSLVGIVDVLRKKHGLEVVIKQLITDDDTYYVKAKRCLPE